MEPNPGPDGPLSDTEITQFVSLLRRYCSHELDQWANVKTETPYGPVYVMFTRALPPEWPPEAFRDF